MNKIGTFILFLAITYSAFTQDASVTARKQQFQESNFIPGNFTRDLPPPTAQLKGSFYLYDEWNKGSIYLFNQTSYSDLQLKYDLKNEALEIKMSDFDRVLPIKQVQAFKWSENGSERLYMNTSNFIPKGAPTDGFFRILVEGKAILASKTRTEIVKASYNVALNVGERDDRIEKVVQYYLIIDEKPRLIPRRKKDFWPYFGVQADQMKAFAEAKRLDTRSESDLVQLVTYYNSLVK
jgi:hypothetical protein